MDNLAQIPLTLALAKATLAAGTTVTLSTTGTLHFAIKGKAYSHAALSNQTTLSVLDAVTAAAPAPILVSTGAIMVVGFNAAGTMLLALGPAAAIGGDGKFITAPQFPVMPDTMCPFGYIVIKLDSTASTWTSGVSSYAAAPTGVTYTYVDVITLPARPQVA